jgi:hypothetical protein
MFAPVVAVVTPTNGSIAAFKTPPTELEISTVRVAVVDVPRAELAKVRLPPVAGTVKVSGRVNVGSVRAAGALLCAVTEIVPVTAPLTAIVPLPPTLSFPAAK